jgi:CBS domain containing-hemolysin-like protein
MLLLTIAIAVAVLIAANALYVAAEFAAVSVSRVRIRARAEEGHALARWLQPIVEQPRQLDRYIAACQVGITLSSLLLGAYGEAALAPPIAGVLGDLGGFEDAAAHSAAFAVVLIGLSVAQMVLGELVPKALALQFPDRTALLTAPAMAWSLRVLAPLIWVFNGSGLALLRLIGVRQATHRHIHSPAEIDLLLADAGSQGALDSEERGRLRRALRLSSLRASDLMVARHQIVAIEVDTLLEEVMRIGAEEPYTRFPVFRGELDHTVGILHTKDAVRAHARGTPRLVVGLLRPVMSLPLDAAADRILVTMRERRASQAVVVDDKGRVAGMLTLRDVLGAVFGALADEFKNGPSRSRGRTSP